MPSTFYAIPLFKKGESFLLRTTNNGTSKVIVVDCGYTADKEKGHLSLQRYLAGKIPDIGVIDRLIITHEDSDHCEGAGQFINEWHNSGKQIKEVWLPAHWAVADNAPLQDGYERTRFEKEALVVAVGICDQLNEFSRDEDGPFPTEIETEDVFVLDYLAQIISEKCRESGVFNELFSDRTNPRNPEMQSRGSFREEGFQSSGVSRYRLGLPYRQSYESPPTALASRIVKGVLDTHKKMASTIAACLQNHVNIRWFDFKSFSEHRNNEISGGDRGFLIPVNSREVRPTWKKLSYGNTFLALAFTCANRESLVFYRPEENKEPSVLFTADSKLKLRHKAFPMPAGMPGNHRLLATAMHHASASNNPGYRVLKNWLGPQKYPPIFVKNGGVGVRNAAFCFTTAQDRQCVRCIPDTNGNSLIRVDSATWGWQIPANPNPCKCQS